MLYILAGIVAVVAILLVPANLEPMASAIVQATATIALAAVATEALLASRALVEATRDLTEATRSHAVVANAAVEAAHEATQEGRRQSLLAATPFVRIDRPQLGNDPVDQGLAISVPVRNLGPGPALEIKLRLEVQDRGAGSFRDYNQGSWTEALLDDQEGAFTQLLIKAQDLLNARHVGWRQLVETPDGTERARLPADLLVPDAIRVHVAWLSVRGVKAEQIYLWRTEDITLLHPWTWQFASLSFDLGSGNGEPVRFGEPAEGQG